MAFIVAVRVAAILLLAAPAVTELTNEVETISAGDWKYFEVPLHNKGARIIANYDVLSGSNNVRMALLLHEDLDRMGPDLPGTILATPEGRRGSLVDPIRRTGDYVVVIDNQDGRQAVRVHLRVALDFGAGREREVGRLTPRRQLTVVAVSCVAFLGIVALSAQRLRKSMRS
ncbi:MAG TPA: hypothetical protein VHW09_01040 [Bryobacteraceae bacterium]|jgi:hypothetical protein|nr:hypothetical protein [Bryobacteraceae bacterium]